ncbi:fibronectin type III domain-containing protein [Fodinicola acaciae]|uniref:fibronectin type III domain-containing protein n=1 Tax=Fodinicola acaciae TaxID=2681555 RepID=UPI0013D6DEEE|nr:fibronectin type III domain-containing protein [Fodinicola acaciae]
MKIVWLLMVAVVVAGCGSATTTLTARLDSPVDVTLSWHDSGPAPLGRVVEYANTAAGPYTILDFLAPSRMSYAHRKLIPRTAFSYRVVPYYGQVSAIVELALPPGKYDDAPADWARPRTVAQPAVARQPLRAGGRPTDLRTTVMNANGVRLTWTDRASDEAGYLVELRPAGSADFRVVQLLDANVNSTGIVTLPDEKVAACRVVAFYYGESSNTVSVTTGDG